MKRVCDSLRSIVAHDRICYSAEEGDEVLDALRFFSARKLCNSGRPFFESELENIGRVAEKFEETVDAVLLDERIGILFAHEIEDFDMESRGQKDRRRAQRGVAAGVIAVVTDHDALCEAA